MGRQVIRQTPKPMPTPAAVLAANTGLPKPFLVAGSRGNSANENKLPRFDIHGMYRLVDTDLAAFRDKQLIIFIPGYNNTTAETLSSTASFFRLLHSSLLRENRVDLDGISFVLFTWPGDVGTVYFCDAQEYAHHSGTALYRLISDIGPAPKNTISVVAHSLGAHVGLRAFSILGERNFHQRQFIRVDRALLLAAAVEDDAFHRPQRGEEYHFPEAAFGLRQLHMVVSRGDEVLSGAFRINETDRALGYNGPESMEPLVSLARRVQEVLGETEKFKFELHDFSPNSAYIMNPNLYVHSHGEYWRNADQLNYYVNLIG
ncbi:MAG: alpha/beta hydrolase [Gammaproteobacteria bacterium]